MSTAVETVVICYARDVRQFGHAKENIFLPSGMSDLGRIPRLIAQGRPGKGPSSEVPPIQKGIKHSTSPASGFGTWTPAAQAVRGHKDRKELRPPHAQHPPRQLRVAMAAAP